MTRTRVFRLLAFAVALSVSAALLARDTLKFTVVGIDCKDCAAPILKALNGVTGVRTAKLDWKSGAAQVEVDEGFDSEKIRRALQENGYEAVFPGETRRDLEPLPEEVRKTLDIVSTSEGEKIDVARTVVPGKVTVIDYWATWCSPCHLLDIRLQHLIQANPKVAVRRVNAGKFDNAAAQQATKDFRMAGLPYVRIYDANGKFVGQQTGGKWDEIVQLIDQALSHGGV